MSNSSTDSNKYHGKQCNSCGDILRYKSTDNCVGCKKKTARKYREKNREKINKQSRQYYWDNRDRELERCRRYHAAHPAQSRAHFRLWSSRNKDKVNARTQKRRALKRNAKSEPYNFKAICNHYGNKCLVCGCDDTKLTIDHIKPLSLGGDDVADNIQPLCLSCNSSKKDRYIDYRPDKGLPRWIQKKLIV